MRSAIAAVSAVLVVLSTSACGSGARQVQHRASTATLPWWQTAPKTVYGRAESLTPLGPGYLVRFDLAALFGPDQTGLHACVDNHECPSGTSDFADDTYQHDFDYVVTYYVPPTTPVELVGESVQVIPPVTARYFYGMIHGRNPHRVRTMMPRRLLLDGFAFYLEIGNRHGPSRGRSDYEAVDRMAQLYHP